MLRAQCNDREALEALLRSVQPTLRRYLSGLAGTTEADDLLQDVLVIVVRRLGSLEDPKLPVAVSHCQPAGVSPYQEAEAVERTARSGQGA